MSLSEPPNRLIESLFSISDEVQVISEKALRVFVAEYYLSQHSPFSASKMIKMHHSNILRVSESRNNLLNLYLLNQKLISVDKRESIREYQSADHSVLRVSEKYSNAFSDLSFLFDEMNHSKRVMRVLFRSSGYLRISVGIPIHKLLCPMSLKSLNQKLSASEMIFHYASQTYHAFKNFGFEILFAIPYSEMHRIEKELRLFWSRKIEENPQFFTTRELSKAFSINLMVDGKGYHKGSLNANIAPIAGKEIFSFRIFWDPIIALIHMNRFRTTPLREVIFEPRKKGLEDIFVYLNRGFGEVFASHEELLHAYATGKYKKHQKMHPAGRTAPESIPLLNHLISQLS